MELVSMPATKERMKGWKMITLLALERIRCNQACAALEECHYSGWGRTAEGILGRHDIRK